MKCKKCGHEESFLYDRYIVKAGQRHFSNGTLIPKEYIGFTLIPHCKKCGEPFEDYVNFSTDYFMKWLTDMDETVDRKLKGKALIRYFELDKLLDPKKDAGD